MVWGRGWRGARLLQPRVSGALGIGLARGPRAVCRTALHLCDLLGMGARPRLHWDAHSPDITIGFLGSIQGVHCDAPVGNTSDTWNARRTGVLSSTLVGAVAGCVRPVSSMAFTQSWCACSK